MPNPYGITLDEASIRWAATEGVSEMIITAVLLLHERSVDEVAAKLTPDELGHVIRLVGRPSCYPPGTLAALKSRSLTHSHEPPSVGVSTDQAPSQRAAHMPTSGARDGVTPLSVVKTSLKAVCAWLSAKLCVFGIPLAI